MFGVTTLIATACFTFAAGIFTVLSLVEKPVWSLMRDPMSQRATDSLVREIHAQLRRVIHLLPPTMMVTMGGGASALVLQAWAAGFNLPSLFILGYFTVCMAYMLTYLKRRIQAVDATPSDSAIAPVRKGLGELAFLHHVGLFTAVTVTGLQIAFAITR